MLESMQKGEIVVLYVVIDLKGWKNKGGCQSMNQQGLCQRMIQQSLISKDKLKG